MGINPISTMQSGAANLPQAHGKDVRPAERAGSGTAFDPDAEAAVFERSEPADTPFRTYSRGTVASAGASIKTDARYAGLRRLVESLFGLQAAQKDAGTGKDDASILEKYDGQLKSYFASLDVDSAAVAEARQAVSDDGYWGVRQTSERLIRFAVSISGGDASKLEELKAAIGKGYAAAEKAWGGALPDICMQTRDAALKGLDEWASGLYGDGTQAGA